MQVTFICNQLTVKNTPSLKQRDEFEVILTAERALYANVVGLEAFEKNTHFKIIIEDVKENTSGTLQQDAIDGEILKNGFTTEYTETGLSEKNLKAIQEEI